MSSWHPYSKLYNIGHNALSYFFNGPVQVQEKVDGSQLSFGVLDGELKMRSKNREFEPHGPDKMFSEAATSILGLEPQLHPGWTYRGEYLRKPKHNVLKYDRVPVGHVAIFDIAVSEESYLPYPEMAVEAKRLGLEPVPQLVESMHLSTTEQVANLLKIESFLGGTTVEGLVFKRYSPQYDDKTGRVLMAKYVSRAFREKHYANQAERPTNIGTVVDQLVRELTTNARYQKAVQHLSEDGILEGSLRDIGPLVREVIRDLEEEEAELIKERLFNHHVRDIRRGVTGGIPAWYKAKLVEDQLDGHCNSGQTTSGDVRPTQNVGVWQQPLSKTDRPETTEAGNGGACDGVDCCGVLSLS